MLHGFDVSAGIEAAAGGRAGAWQFIRDFARWWRSPLADGDGYGEADTGAAEQRLGVRFPAAVRGISAARPADLDRFSLACVEIVLSESLFAGAGLDDNKPLDEAALTSLGRDVTQLALPAYPLWTGPPVIGWFAGPDVILRADGDAWVWVRARTACALDLARQAMPGGWELAPGPARP